MWQTTQNICELNFLNMNAILELITKLCWNLFNLIWVKSVDGKPATSSQVLTRSRRMRRSPSMRSWTERRCAARVSLSACSWLGMTSRRPCATSTRSSPSSISSTWSSWMKKTGDTSNSRCLLFNLLPITFKRGFFSDHFFFFFVCNLVEAVLALFF